MLDSIFEKYSKRVKATVQAPKDAQGISRTVKLNQAPSGAITDDAEWLVAAEAGVTITERLKTEDGRSRSKSLALSGEDEGESEDSAKITGIVLGVEEAPKRKRRSGRADTTKPEANGRHAEESEAN